MTRLPAKRAAQAAKPKPRKWRKGLWPATIKLPTTRQPHVLSDAELLLRCRFAWKWNQAQMGKAIFRSERAVRRWEHGTPMPPLVRRAVEEVLEQRLHQIRWSFNPRIR